MAAVKISSTNPYSLNTVKMRAMMFGIQYDAPDKNRIVMYGDESKINRCVLALSGIEVTNRYDAIEFSGDE